MRFIDEAKVVAIAGKGGDGFVAWRREKYVPRGGPEGGDGGNGGAVVLVTNPGLNTLIDFSFKPLMKAEDGGSGGPKQLHGRDGENGIFEVPVGTQVFFEDKLIADLSEPGSRWVAAKGGRGGKGNEFFKSATRQAPDFAQPGQPGERLEFKLVLKSVADVGLVGFPNVGKSTLVATVSKARPKVADYPFTTLRPSLGVVALPHGGRFVIADIPGLISGAHEGKGLGIQFLKHIERTEILVHMIDVTQAEDYEDGMNQFEAIRRELGLFSEELLEKPYVVVFTKADLNESRQAYEVCKIKFEANKIKTFLISTVTNEGLDELLECLYEMKIASLEPTSPITSDSRAIA